MKKFTLYLLFTGLFLLSVFEKAFAQPLANFSAAIVSGCAPLVINFSDNSTGNPTQWNWDLGNGTLSALKNPSTTYINPGTYTVTLTASNTTGTNTITKTAYITVYDKPRVNFTVTDSSNCIPFVAGFTDLSTTTFGSITAWEWNFDDATNSTEQNPQHSFTQTGNYNISLKATNDAGCFNILNKLAYIKASEPLRPSFSFTQPVNCKPPETISFTNATQGPGTLSYVWDFGDGNSSNTNNPAHTYTTGGLFSIKLVVNNSIGCTDTLFYKDTLTIKNNQTIIDGLDTVCINKMMMLTNASTPAPLTSRWIFDDGTTGFGASIAKTWSTAGPHTVTLISNYGYCSDSVIKTITVLEPPTANFTATDSFFCKAPALVNFVDLSAGALSWNWDFGDSSFSNTQNPLHTYTADEEFQVSLTVTNAPGCTNTFTKYRFIKIAAPSISIDTKEGGGCIPYTFRPYPSVNTIDSVTNYLWDFGNGNTSTVKYPIETYTNTGTYTVKLFITTATGCRDSLVIDSAVRTGTPPTVDFTFTPNQVCPRTDVQFTSQSTPADKWMWHFGDNEISTIENAVHQYLDSSIYTVKLIAWNNGCSDSITKNRIITVLPGAARFTPEFNCTNKKEVVFRDSSVAAQNWNWNFGDGATSTLQNPVHQFSDYQTYTVSLTTTSGSCTNTDSIKVNIINETADFLVEKNTGCKDEIFAFYTASVNRNNITQYIWNFGDGNIDSSSATDSVKHIYQNGGSYTASLTITDINGCSSTKIKTGFVLVSAPQAAFGLTSTGGCTNQTLNFTDSSTSNIVQWYWNFGDGQTRVYTSTQPSLIPYTYSSAGQYYASLVVTDSAGCVDSVINTVPVSIYQPIADFNSPNFITCINDGVLFQNTSIGENLTYAWNFGDNTFSADSLPVKQYTRDGDYTPTLVVTDMFGCKDSVSKTDYIKVKTVTASFNTNDTIGLCIPFHASFTNNSLNAGSQTWDFGDGGYSSTVNPNYYYSAPGTYYAKLKAIRSGTCFSVDSVRIKISAPSGVLNYNPQNGCAPLNVSFSVTTNDRVSFIWDFNDGTSYTSYNAAVNYTYNLPGSFVPRVVLKDTFGCAVPLYSADTIQLYNTSVNFIAEDNIICNGDWIQFRDSSFSGSPVVSHRWDFGDGSFSNELHPLHQYINGGNYTVKLIITTRFGCQDSMVRSNYVQVYSKPDVSISGNNVDYCGPTNINFSGNQLNTGSDSIQWKWDFGNGNIAVGKNPPAQQYSDTGFYQIQLTASYNEGCADTATTTLTIKPLPNLIISNDTSVCIASSIQLLASGVDTYRWLTTASLTCTDCPNPVLTTLNNTYVYVTGSNNIGCEKTDSVFIAVKKPFTLNGANDTAACSGKSLQLNISGAEQYSWYPAVGLSNAFVGNPLATPSTTTSYKVVGTDGLNCFRDSAIITVKVYNQPYVNAGSDINSTANNSIVLAPVYSGDITSYQWIPAAGLSCNSCPNPAVTPATSTTYKIEVTNPGGCKASDEVRIFVKCDNSSITMPTAFSPNNDGKNDHFYPLGNNNITISSFKIFNRYGQLIFIAGNFRINDKSAGWDGRYKGQDQPTGNYIYSIEFICSNNEVNVVNGNIMLLR